MRNNVRNMRSSSVLTALFPQVRQGVLAATLGQPDKWWYLSELAGRLGTSPSSLQRELSSLEEPRKSLRLPLHKRLSLPMWFFMAVLTQSLIADAPISIPVAKTRIPAAPVTYERICGST